MSNSRWYRLALSILLLCAMFWLWKSRFNELVYHTFAKSELIDLGDATTFDREREKIPLNSYVSVSGILGNKAATISGLRAGSFHFGRNQIRHLLGSKLYVEYDQAEYHQKFRPFTRIQVQGRLISFGPGSELEKVRTFFKTYYNHTVDDNAMLIVVGEVPRSEIIYALLFLLSIGLLVVSFYFSIKPILSHKKVNT